MADIDLDRLQALHDAAAESQWPKWKFSDFPLTDCQLAVGARNALPSLLAEVRELRAEREKTEAALRTLCGIYEGAVAAFDAPLAKRNSASFTLRQIKHLGLWREPKETP